MGPNGAGPNQNAISHANPNAAFLRPDAPGNAFSSHPGHGMGQETAEAHAATLPGTAQGPFTSPNDFDPSPSF